MNYKQSGLFALLLILFDLFFGVLFAFMGIPILLALSTGLSFIGFFTIFNLALLFIIDYYEELEKKEGKSK